MNEYLEAMREVWSEVERECGFLGELKVAFDYDVRIVLTDGMSLPKAFVNERDREIEVSVPFEIVKRSDPYYGSRSDGAVCLTLYAYVVGYAKAAGMAGVPGSVALESALCREILGRSVPRSITEFIPKTVRESNEHDIIWDGTHLRRCALCEIGETV